MSKSSVFQIVIIRKDGEDGGKLPLDVGEYTFGRFAISDASALFSHRVAAT